MTKINAITKFTLDRIERLRELVREDRVLRQRREQLGEEAMLLRSALGSAGVTLKSASDAGAIPVEEYQAVRRAMIELEAEETGIPLPADLEPQEPEKTKTLLEVLDAITAGIEGQFRADDARQRLAPHLAELKKAPHRASITGALNRLAQDGKLERVSGGGRGNEATYRRIGDFEKLVKSIGGTEETPMISTTKP
jgi:hypothetical protein